MPTWFGPIEIWFCFIFRDSGTGVLIATITFWYISLNPGPINGSQQYNNDQWVNFKKRGVHFVHININSLLPKLDELRYITKWSETAIIGISEQKLDDSVLSFEIQTESYDLIYSDANRHGVGVACFIRNDLSYNKKSFLPSEIENIFIEIFYCSQSLLLGVTFIVHQTKAVLLI